MKVNVTKNTPPFTPVTMTVTVESQAEADALYAMFVTSCIVETVQTAFGVRIPYSDASLISATGMPCNTLTDALRKHLARN